MKKILIPTDFSDFSTYASDYAIELAKQCQLELVFMHVMSIPVDWLNISLDQKKMYPDVTKKVNKAQNQLNKWVDKADHEGVIAKEYIHFNEGYQHIVKYAVENACDLIIMGSKGIDSLSSIFVGSHTLRIVRVSETPVLVVNKPIQKVKKVAFISTFERESHALIDYIADFIKLTNYKLHLVYINTPLSFLDSGIVQNRMAKFKNKLGLSAKSSIHNDYAFDTGINNFCDRNNIDLVITATHHKSGIDRFVSGSLTENMIQFLHVPVLSIPLLENEN